MPKMEGNIAIEHGHRMLATFVGILTIGLLALLWKHEGGRYRSLGVAALILVIFQGILGGITVIYQLPDLVSTAHLGTAMIFISLLTLIYCKISGAKPLSWKSHSSGERGWLILSLAVVYLQILFGAFVRHTGSGIACTDIPLCQNLLWPGEPSQQLHMGHRFLGMIVLTVILLAPWVLRRVTRISVSHRKILLALLVLVSLQVIFGFWSAASSLALLPVTAHLAGAAGMMIALVALFFHSGFFECSKDTVGAKNA